ncbi:MAG TPA: bifunctional shikimate kinase/3-dehydroquinate synthase [Solirubrobacteraceae bacterium]
MAPTLKPALVFIGFMAAGKSTAAREAATALGVTADDADALLEAKFGEPIETVFDREGEAAFRAAEQELAVKLLDDADGGVIALGGGALQSDEVRSALERHVTVLVDVDLDTAWARAHGHGRPLARDRAAFEALFHARAPVYDAAANAVVPGMRTAAVRGALGAIQAIPEGHRLLWATSASGDYPVWVGPLERAPWPSGGRRIVISDETVAQLHGARMPEPAGSIEIPPGEEHKTLHTAERVWHALVAQGATRADQVVALGGGVVGDMAGFCAATYQRGMPVVHVPTTLVAQVDSAYGGKTGVDLPQAKNYVGAYHQPAAVLTDPGLLQTLPPAEMAAGFAEVVKTALIAGGALWDRVAQGAAVDEAIIAGCARTKLRVVAADERDTGARQALNLGHTVGHAIETATGYVRYRHGEAVGLGLLVALRLSSQDALRELVGDLLSGAGLPTQLDGADPEQVVAATARDKKRTGESVPFVLVERPGRVTTGHPVAAADLLSAVRELCGR